MSLILDALRKMELERKAKRQSSQEIRTEVLNYRGNPQVSKKPRLLPVIAALLLFSSATAFFLFHNNSGGPKAGAVKAAVPAVVPPPADSITRQTDPLPRPPAEAVPPARGNRPAAATVPAAQNEELRQPSGNDNNIAISGIAWQEERSLRRAVINGSLVSEGAEVDGAKVVDIRENLVRFSRQGRSFEVFYSSGSGR